VHFGVDNQALDLDYAYASGNKGGQPVPYVGGSFKTRDDRQLVYAWYAKQLPATGWERYVYEPGPKLLEYFPGGIRFGWPDRKGDYRKQPFFLFDIFGDTSIPGSSSIRIDIYRYK